MTPKEFASELENIILESNGELLASLLDIQDKIYSRVLVKLKNLEVDEFGNILQTSANRKITREAADAFSRALNQSGYLSNVEKYISVIPQIDTLSENYFTSISDAFKPNRQFMADLQKQTIESLETQMFNDGLESQVKRPLVDILNQNVNTGGQFSGFLEQVRSFITGNDKVEGRLLKYARTYTRDALFNYSRSLQQAVTKDLGLVWFFYLGGTMDKTRAFCLERVDQYWHESEIKKWASLDWQGKRSDTTESSIFIYAGGWNCTHSLVPVSDSVVKDQVKKDAFELMKQARAVGNELDEEAKRIAKKYNADLTPLNYKSAESIMRKAKDELNGVVFGPDGIKDAVRTTIITDANSLKAVAADVKDLKITTRLKAQDFSKTSGYKGYLVNVKLSNGTIGEIQINTPEMIFAKESPKNAKAVIGEDVWNAIQKKTGLEGGLGHKFYEQDRDIIIDPKNVDPAKVALKEAIQQKSRDYYSQFYYSYPTDWP